MFAEDILMLDFSYESDAAASYLVLNLGSGSSLIEYQVEMINRNSFSHILPISIRQINGKASLYYNLTSKIVLTQFLKRKVLNREEVLLILQNITRPILQSKNYLLTDTNFLLDVDYIYVNPETMDISLVYIPLQLEIDFNRRFKDFVRKFLFSIAQIDDSPSDNYMHRILKLMNSETFSVGELDRLLNDLKISQAIRAEAENAAVVSKPDAASCNSAVGRQNEIDPKGDSDSKSYIYTWFCKKRNLMITVLTQVMLLLAVLLAVLSLAGNKQLDFSTLAGISLIAASLEVLLYKKLFSGRNLQMVEESSLQEKKDLEAVKPKAYAWEFPGKPAAKEEADIIALKNRVAAFKQSLSSEEVIVGERAVGLETVMLAGPKGGKAFLKGSYNGVIENITINKNRFLLGRLKGQVDYITKNSAVGKIHAEIICSDGAYCIIDMNSRNGTYINGERIKSNIEYPLKNRDRVALADSEYIFTLEEQQ